MQDLHSTDSTQEKCATVDHAGYTGPTRQHELDRTRSGIDLASKDPDHEARIDDLCDLSQVRNIIRKKKTKRQDQFAGGTHLRGPFFRANTKLKLFSRSCLYARAVIHVERKPASQAVLI